MQIFNNEEIRFIMKKLISLCFVVFFAAAGCMNNKPAVTTLLGDGTPYYQYPEMLVGKVSNVTEKNFWAIPDGDTFKKGTQLTSEDRKNLGGWTPDYEAAFNDAGELALCKFLDETGTTTSTYQIAFEEGKTLKGKNLVKDSLAYYDVFKVDENGKRTGFERFHPIADTIMGNLEINTGKPENTMEYKMVTTKGAVLYKLVVYFNDKKQFTHSEAFGKDGTFRYSNVVKYNEKGNVSELTLLDKERKVSAVNYFTYDYDNKGNWTRAIVKDDKGIVVIEERNYSYYD